MTATSLAACTGTGAVWTATTGAIKVGTGGQRVVTVGNAETDTALNLNAGSGNMATTVTSGTYSVDSTGAIALESSAGEIVIGAAGGWRDCRPSGCGHTCGFAVLTGYCCYDCRPVEGAAS